MAVDFFTRFNLYNSVSNNELGVRVLKAYLDMKDNEISDMLDEIDSIQQDFAARLTVKYPCEIKALKRKRVLFLGDSITSDNLGYRGKLTRACCFEAIDGSVSGGTSSMLLNSALMLIRKEKPDLVSLMIGSNDSVSIADKDLNQVSISEYERNVRKIIEWAKESGAKLLLFEVPPVNENYFERAFSRENKLQSNETIGRYNAVLRRIAEDNSLALQQNGYLSERAEYYEPDGIHLSMLGHELFSEKWLIAASKII